MLLTTTVTSSTTLISDLWLAITSNITLFSQPQIINTQSINVFPQFSRDILKPNYNSVDLTEVELVHEPNFDESRHINPELFLVGFLYSSFNHLIMIQDYCTLCQMRKGMVDQRVDEARLPVKVHMEEMRRVEVQNTTYYYNPISETPFSLALAFAGEQGGNLVTGGAATGHWPEVGGIEEVHGEATCMSATQLHHPASGLLASSQWALHPDWTYCSFNYAVHRFESAEENLRHFLEKMERPGRPEEIWGGARVPPLAPGVPAVGRHSHYCDRQLVEGLLLDAEITNAFSDGLFRSTVLDPLGVSLVFVATRTGLTRSGPMLCSGLMITSFMVCLLV